MDFDKGLVLGGEMIENRPQFLFLFHIEFPDVADGRMPMLIAFLLTILQRCYSKSSHGKI